MIWLMRSGFLSPSGTQEDSGGLGHGPGLAAVPGPAGIHARARLPRRERPGVLPGSPGGGPAGHDQRVGATVLGTRNDVVEEELVD